MDVKSRKRLRSRGYVCNWRLKCAACSFQSAVDNSLFCFLAFIYHYFIVFYFSWSLDLLEHWEKSFFALIYESLSITETDWEKPSPRQQVLPLWQNLTRYVSPCVIQITSSDFWSNWKRLLVGYTTYSGIVQKVTVITILIF